MLNSTKNFAKFAFYLSSTALLLFSTVTPAYSQFLPQVWGTVGTQDDDISYGAGLKWAGFGVEVGTGKEGATGGDVLTFISLPFVSPYVGLGVYSGDDTVAYSGGVHLYPGSRIFIGGGYHSIRGINGKLGFRF
ncbi:MAG: hypothetical protein QNJ70_24435 [Xenococcaceae cyanobacterium MO_207.B15]|nr:hypothetical protein [Xenococcaceae cyanobacterium MO_207.B15]MDJ0742854.1 hypothetical protein [Xenococcaceae cyanobacterium MO_167.B27]